MNSFNNPSLKNSSPDYDIITDKPIKKLKAFNAIESGFPFNLADKSHQSNRKPHAINIPLPNSTQNLTQEDRIYHHELSEFLFPKPITSLEGLKVEDQNNSLTVFDSSAVSSIRDYDTVHQLSGGFDPLRDYILRCQYLKTQTPTPYQDEKDSYTTRDPYRRVPSPNQDYEEIAYNQAGLLPRCLLPGGIPVPELFPDPRMTQQTYETYPEASEWEELGPDPKLLMLEQARQPVDLYSHETLHPGQSSKKNVVKRSLGKRSFDSIDHHHQQQQQQHQQPRHQSSTQRASAPKSKPKVKEVVHAKEVSHTTKRKIEGKAESKEILVFEEKEDSEYQYIHPQDEWIEYKVPKDDEPVEIIEPVNQQKPKAAPTSENPKVTAKSVSCDGGHANSRQKKERVQLIYEFSMQPKPVCKERRMNKLQALKAKQDEHLDDARKPYVIHLHIDPNDPVEKVIPTRIGTSYQAVIRPEHDGPTPDKRITRASKTVWVPEWLPEDKLAAFYGQLTEIFGREVENEELVMKTLKKADMNIERTVSVIRNDQAYFRAKFFNS